MVSGRRFLMAGMATLLLAGACTSIGPSGPTIPAINIPSIPPLNLPSGGLGGLPGLPGLPSGGLGGLFPSGLGIAIPTGSVPCALISAAEVTQIWGAPMTDTSDNATNCGFVSSSLFSVSVQATTDTDLSGAQFLFGNTVQQINVGGYPGIQGAFLGQAAVYLQKPSGQLQVLGILTGTDAATYTKLEQVAATAIQRMP
jgi:hypothetical protein